MYKKTLLSLAVASTLTLTGCLDDGDNFRNAAPEYKITLDTDGKVFPVFNPVTSELPIPNDLIFDKDAGDGSFKVKDSKPPVTSALNQLSGSSTTAPIDILFSGLVDTASVNGDAFLKDADGNLVLNEGIPVPNPNQNIFLIELDYASGDPVQGLPIGEPPTIPLAVSLQTNYGILKSPETTPAQKQAAAQAIINEANNPTYTVSVIEVDGAHAVRIHPLKPLNPRTRYIVAITDEVKDSQGQQIVSSSAYNNLSIPADEAPTGASSLDAVQALVTGLWEPVAEKYFGLPNGSRPETAQLSSDNIAMSYSFTTSDDEKVLDYIAEPTGWLEDRIEDLIKITATKTAIKGGASDYTAVKGVVDKAYNDWRASDLSPALAACDAAGGGDAGVACASGALYTNLLGGTATFTSQPQATTITMNGAPLDVTDLVPDLSAKIPIETVLVDQGSITIPYYSGIPTGFPTPPTEATAAAGAGLPLKYASWEADATLATTLNVTFYCAGLALPQGKTAPALGSDDELDCSGALNPADFKTPPASKVVNYIFPFPKKQEDVTIPILAIYPHPNKTGGATNLKTMMWGHGLTGNRSNALGFGSLLVAQGLSNAVASAGQSLNAVIAIDEPLHGITSGPLEASAFNAIERHFGFQNAGAGPENPPKLIEEGGSGSMFINLENFLTARDNNRQHVLDLFSVRKSLPATTLSGHTLTGNYFYSGHSLGTINSQAFVAIANDTAVTDDDITAAAFFTPGGGIARFFENSPAFASTLADALANEELTPDTSSYQTYLNVFQATVDSVDAVNFADRFKGKTPVNYFLAVNDLVIPVDISEESRTLQSVTSLGNTVSGSVDYLSGAEPLVTLSGASALTKTPGQQSITQSVARYKPCAATHSSPSIPNGSDVPDGATYMNNAFVENLSHTVGLLTTNGAEVTVTPNFTTLQQDLPLPALILDEGAGC